MVLLLAMLTGCLDYTIDPTKGKENLEADTGEDDPVVADTGEVEEEEDTDDGLGWDDDTTAAESPVYANTAGVLYEVEPDQGEASLIGEFADRDGEAIDTFIDIAIDLRGRMYGGTFDALYRIDPNTAVVEKICDTEVQMTALTFTSAGVLIAGGDNVIVQLAIPTCNVERLVPSSGYLTSGDLVGLPDGYLYWTVEGERGDELVRVDPNDGGEEWVGVIGVEKLFGLGYTAGTLYGFSSGGHIVAISPDEAGAATMAEDEEMRWWGATTNPVRWE